MAAKKAEEVKEIVGLVKVKVVRGTNLAVRDVSSSDPYVVLKLGNQEVRTRSVRRTTEPVWNEDLTLTVDDLNHLVATLEVYDRDTFVDDPMGAAEFEIGHLVEAAEEMSRRRSVVPDADGAVLKTLTPSRRNCLAGWSSVVWSGGKVVQSLVLRLRNVECGEVELQLEWRGNPSARRNPSP